MADRRTTAARDIAAGAVLLVLAGLYTWQTRQISQSSLSDDVGPEGLPYVLAATLAFIAVLIILKGAVGLLAAAPAAAAAVADDGVKAYVATLPRALGFLAIGIGYILIGPVVGYIAGLTLLIAAVALYEGAPVNLQTGGVAVGVAVLFWVIFVQLLGTEQPIAWFLR